MLIHANTNITHMCQQKQKKDQIIEIHPIDYDRAHNSVEDMNILKKDTKHIIHYSIGQLS